MSSEDRYRYWEKTYGNPRAKAGKDWYGPWKEFQKDVAGPAFSKTDASWQTFFCVVSQVEESNLGREGFADLKFWPIGRSCGIGLLSP